MDRVDVRREVRPPSKAYVGMTNNQPLTITVEQAAQVLGVGRSTAYELVRAGELPEPESNGIAYLKIPLNRLGATP